MVSTPSGSPTRFAGAFFMPAEALRLEVGKRRSALAFGELLALSAFSASASRR